jgi:diadenosine tetraphosphate (Ap4A) HIT family hydrolase
MDCSFCEIVKGTRTARIIHRTPGFVVFEPMTKAEGKLLIVPATHYQALGDMPMTAMAEWLTVAHELQTKVGALSCKMQINVGSKFQNVRHLYMQFTYQKG